MGDITAILLMVSRLDMCEAVIAESKGDLHAKNFISAMAEQFGAALGRGEALRNADNNLKMSEVTNQVHDISKVFTGAVYDILVDMYESISDPNKYDQAETLHRVGKHLTSLVIASLLSGPETEATFSDIANKMIELEKYDAWKVVIENQFSIRQVLGSSAVGISATLDRSFSGCCGSMKGRG
ncbi:MAG: hypothetical protein HRU25_18175 [Psychrobium sp.]|nr:hypothetical protein [Psychrobium sp.]